MFGGRWKVTHQVHEAWNKPQGNREACALVTLDVKNVFNSVRWRDLLSAPDQYQVPEYIGNVLENYLRDRVLRYGTTEGESINPVTSGAALGSANGPDMCNFLYDALLRLEMPSGSRLVTAISKEALRRRIKWAIRRILRWLKEYTLELAISKTVMVVVTRRKSFKGDF